METPNEPALEVTMNGERFLATRENTTLFQFFGHLAVYDHVFIQTSFEDSTPKGAYLFRNQEVWGDLVDFIVTNEYPQHVCLREVAQCDVDAFERTMYGDVRGLPSFPQEWADGSVA